MGENGLNELIRRKLRQMAGDMRSPALTERRCARQFVKRLVAATVTRAPVCRGHSDRRLVSLPYVPDGSLQSDRASAIAARLPSNSPHGRGLDVTTSIRFGPAHGQNGAAGVASRAGGPDAGLPSVTRAPASAALPSRPIRASRITWHCSPTEWWASGPFRRRPAGTTWNS